MLKIFTYQDRSVLAGLTWGPSRPSSLLRRAPWAVARSLAANDLALHWEDRTALVPDEPEYIGKASLLSMLAGHLSEEELIGRVFCAFEIAEQFLWFAAVLVNGKPAIGAERLFDTLAELITHIEAECSNGQIDRLAIEPYLAEDIAEDVTRRIAGCYLCPTAYRPAPNPICVEGKPASRMPFGLAGWKIAAGAGASVLAVTAGILFWVSVQQSEPAVSAPRIAAVQTTFRDEVGFARNCLAAFAGIWPIAPGWQMTAEGCATPAMRDPALTGFAPALANDLALADDPAHGVAYRIYQLRGGWDDAIARKAADAVYAGSAVHMEIRGNRLVSSIEIAAPMLEAATTTDQSAATPEAAGSSASSVTGTRVTGTRVSLTPAELLAATEAVFLGLADSIRLDGNGNGNSTIGSSPKVRVMLKSGFEDIFERVQRIEGAEIARLSRNGKTVTLEITARQMIIVPLSRPLEHVMLCRPNGACEKALPRQGMALTGLKTSARESAGKTTATRTRSATQARAADRGRALPTDAPETAVNTREDVML